MWVHVYWMQDGATYLLPQPTPSSHYFPAENYVRRKGIWIHSFQARSWVEAYVKLEEYREAGMFEKCEPKRPIQG